MTDELKPCRDAFEAWRDRDRPSLLRHMTCYMDLADLNSDAIAWDAWQAAWNRRSPAGGASSEAPKPEPTVAYSLDEERYTEDLDDIMMQLDDAGNLVEGATYWVGDVVCHKASDFTEGCADSILDLARDAAFEAAGEWAEDFAYPVSQALRDDLERVVGEWADKNLPVTFWTVTKTREVDVTAADVRDYGALATGAAQGEQSNG